MKKYILGLTLFFTIHTVDAMKLSDEDKQVINLTKLIYENPKRLPEIYNDDFTPTIRNKIFTTIVFNFLYEDAKQYYAISNALKFIKIKKQKDIFHHGFKAKLYKECFLSETNNNTDSVIKIKYKNKPFNDANDGNKEKIKECEIGVKGYKKDVLKNYPLERIQKLEDFLSDNTKEARRENFTTLLNNYIDNLSKTTNSEEATKKFLKLLMLKNHENKRSTTDWEDPQEQFIEYIILPFEELLSPEKINYDIEFFDTLAKSNAIVKNNEPTKSNKKTSMVEFDEEKLQKWQQFGDIQQNCLLNIGIQLKKAPYTPKEHTLIHTALLTNAISPDLILLIINTIASKIGLGYETLLLTPVSLFANLCLNIILCQKFSQIYANSNSQKPLIQTCIQQKYIEAHEEHKNHLYGETFFISHVFHIICSLIAHQCLSLASLPGQIIGIGIHGLRILCYYLLCSYRYRNDTRNDIYQAKSLKTNT